MADNTMITNTQLAVSLTRVEERIANMADDIHRIEVTIEGFINGTNGRPGVMERIALGEQAIVGLAARVTNIETTERESAKVSGKTVAALIGVATTLATVIGELIKHLA